MPRNDRFKAACDALEESCLAFFINSAVAVCGLFITIALEKTNFRE